MLKSISCKKLIQTPLIFDTGLNTLVGADNAQNSIGKSSILMLIDFAFGGSDFPIKCDDVIRNIGHLNISIEYEFDQKYSFIRDTENLDEIYDLDAQKYIPLKEFTSFLKEKYLFKKNQISFRECVSVFFRIYQRNNYDDQQPLNIIPKDKWDSIRKRTLKIFEKYWLISELEEQRQFQQKKAQDIKGTFGSGAVKKITKTQFNKNEKEVQDISIEIENIKSALKENVTDIKSIINNRSLSLKKEKDILIDLKLDLEVQLFRVESSLSDSKIRNSKSFQSVVEYFPDIDTDKLAKVESFHKGITKILKEQLSSERKIILENISIAEKDILGIDNELLKTVNSKEDSMYLLERLIEIDRLKEDFEKQNEYLTQDMEVKNEIKSLKENIEETIDGEIREIESTLNAGMKVIIEQIYHDKPILPKIHLGKTSYKFDHGDDRGTGKGFANMIALDITYLEKTLLPCLIHDSLLFKNMDIPAVEHLIGVYNSFKKQIFISIDEVPKYNDETQALIYNAQFLKLNQDRLAFITKWKTRE